MPPSTTPIFSSTRPSRRRPGDLGEPGPGEFDRLLAHGRDRHQGVAKGHEVALLEGGLTYKQTGISQRDMEFLEGRKYNREEVMGGL